MLRGSCAGVALLELLLALVLLSAAILAAGPVVARTAQVLTRGRTVLEGTHLAAQRKELVALGAVGPCGAGSSGQDSGRFVRVDWSATPGPTGLNFLARFLDHAGRFPAETLAAAVPCQP